MIILISALLCAAAAQPLSRMSARNYAVTGWSNVTLTVTDQCGDEPLLRRFMLRSASWNTSVTSWSASPRSTWKFVGLEIILKRSASRRVNSVLLLNVPGATPKPPSVTWEDAVYGADNDTWGLENYSVAQLLSSELVVRQTVLQQSSGGLFGSLRPTFLNITCITVNIFYTLPTEAPPPSLGETLPRFTTTKDANSRVAVIGSTGTENGDTASSADGESDESGLPLPLPALIALALVVLICIIALIAFFVLRGRDKNDSADSVYTPNAVDMSVQPQPHYQEIPRESQPQYQNLSTVSTASYQSIDTSTHAPQW